MMLSASSRRKTFFSSYLREISLSFWLYCIPVVVILHYICSIALLGYLETISLQEGCSNPKITTVTNLSLNSQQEKKEFILRVGILSTYVPQLCGIGEYASEILKEWKSSSSTGKNVVKVEAKILVLHPHGYSEYAYGSDVAFVIRKHILEDYLSAANFANANFDVLLCQHEFGLFGGFLGDYLFAFLRQLHLPVVVTFHTVLANRKGQSDLNHYDEHLNHLLSRSTYATVALKTLCSDLEMASPGAKDKCIQVPHGIANSSPNTSAVLAKHGREMKGKFVILTAGLIGRSKGIGFMIEAMVEIVEEFPNAVYFIVGEEHPQAMEDYANTLIGIALVHGMSQNVKFVRKFSAKNDLEAWFSLADLVVLPYTEPEQVSSGALSMAMGLGRPVISTRFRYSVHMCVPDSDIEQAWQIEQEYLDADQEVVENKTVGTAGVYCMLVDRYSIPKLSTAVLEVMRSKAKQQELGRLGRERTAGMRWREVAAKVLNLCSMAKLQFDALLSSVKIETNHSAALGSIPVPVQNSSVQLREEFWSTVFSALKSIDPKIDSLETGSLAELLLLRKQRGGAARQLSVAVIQSLSHSGLLFSRWVPPTPKLYFRGNQQSSFVLRDNRKILRGSLQDGNAAISRSEHGLVFGRGPNSFFPGIRLNFTGDNCTEMWVLTESWGSQVNATVAVLWTRKNVTCRMNGSLVAMVTNSYVARLDELAVEHSVRVELASAAPAPYLVEVTMELQGMSSGYEGVHASRFYAMFEDASSAGGALSNQTWTVYRESDPGQLAWFMVTDREGSQGLFVVPGNPKEVHSVTCSVMEETIFDRTDAINNIKTKYLWEDPTQTVFEASEKILVTGRVEGSNMTVYDELLFRPSAWPGVDISLVENKGRVLEGLERYWLSMPERTPESIQLLTWLREQGSKF